MLLQTLGITFYNLPNETITGYIFLFAMLFGMLMIRGVYIWMHRKHLYPNDQIYLAVLGAKWLRILSIPMMVALLFLSSRVQPGISAGKFWELDSITRGWWCVIRICIGFLCALCASVFETNPVFRAWASVTCPLLSIMDMVSQANFAVQISCIEHGLCEPNDPHLHALYRYAWRDIVSAVLTLTFTGVSTWLWFIYGVYRNDLDMPRLELRNMSHRLDKIRLKPKEVRRRTDDENELEKMLGYN